jgi:uncharacterized iron-regulated membrane protein
VRSLLKRIHLWLGLTLGLFWSIQGLTGATLAFRHNLERVVLAQPSGGPAAPISDILRAAEGESRGARITRVSITDVHSDTIQVDYSDDRAVFIDASTARILGRQDLQPATPFDGSAMRWLLNLHTNLLTDSEKWVGFSGMVLFTTAIMGLFLAWPPRHVWKWRAWRTNLQRLYGLHRALGLTIVVFVSFSALSGIWMAFADDLRPALAQIVAHQLPYRATRIASLGPVIPAEQAIRVARARLPGASWARLTVPTAKSPVYTIRFHRPEEGVWLGRSSVAVNAGTGAVESVYDSLSAPISNRIADALLPLHNGEQFGLAGRLIIVLVGLSLPTLYVTAVWRWLARSRKRSRVPSPAG